MSTSVTEAGPPPGAEAPGASAVGATARRPSPLEPLISGDHKRLGPAFIYASIAFLLVGTVAAGVILAEWTTSGSDYIKTTNGLQVFTLHATSTFFLFLIPLWIGIATYVVPLQIGAPRIAFPRLHAFAFWLALFAGIVVCASYAVDGGPAVA